MRNCYKITDDGLTHLENVKKINLAWTMVTDDELAPLVNVEVITSTWCLNIIAA